MKKPLNAIVAKNIYRLLEHLGETSVSAGKKSGVNQKTVWNMTQDEVCNPTIKNLEKLARALGVHPSLLLIDSSMESGIPGAETVELLERIVKLSPKARSQVSEFIEMWERPISGQ